LLEPVSDAKDPLDHLESMALLREGAKAPCDTLEGCIRILEAAMVRTAA